MSGKYRRMGNVQGGNVLHWRGNTQNTATSYLQTYFQQVVRQMRVAVELHQVWTSVTEDQVWTAAKDAQVMMAVKEAQV